MNKPHKHAELIKAWADGADIEVMEEGRWFYTCNPYWKDHAQYRIKPEPKPDVVDYFYASVDDISYSDKEDASLKLTFDGETGKLKSAEVL